MGFVIGFKWAELKIMAFDPKCFPFILFMWFDDKAVWGFDIGLMGVYLTISIRKQPFYPN